MLKRIGIGLVGGAVFMLVMWAATFFGIIDWIRPQEIYRTKGMFAVLKPFSMLGIFAFLTLYAYHKWHPQAKKHKNFGSLFVITISFSLGATLIQMPLLYLDQVSLINIYIIESVFFVSSLLITTPICGFYLFLKPTNEDAPTVDKEPLDDLFK